MFKNVATLVDVKCNGTMALIKKKILAKILRTLRESVLEVEIQREREREIKSLLPGLLFSSFLVLTTTY